MVNVKIFDNEGYIQIDRTLDLGVSDFGLYIFDLAYDYPPSEYTYRIEEV